MMCVQYLNERTISAYHHARSILREQRYLFFRGEKSRETELILFTVEYARIFQTTSPPPSPYYFVKSSICGINVPRRIPTSCQVSRGNFPKAKGGGQAGREGRQLEEAAGLPRRGKEKKRLGESSGLNENQFHFFPHFSLAHYPAPAVHISLSSPILAPYIPRETSRFGERLHSAAASVRGNIIFSSKLLRTLGALNYRYQRLR